MSESDLNIIRKLVGTKSLLIGERTVLKQLAAGQLKKIYLAKNARDSLKKETAALKAITDFELEELKITNEDLGVICKKPFAVSVIGVLK